MKNIKRNITWLAVGIILTSMALVHSGIDVPQYKPVDAMRELSTARREWKLLRTEAAETGSGAYDRTGADGDWSDLVANTTTVAATNGMIDVLTTIGWGVNGVEIAFFTDPGDDPTQPDTFDFEIYAWRDSNYGPPVRVYATTGNGCAIGTAILVTHPTSGTTLTESNWCDTISGVDYWQGVSVHNSGNNGICRLTFDLRGYRYLWLRIFNAAGGGTECAGVGALISGY